VAPIAERQLTGWLPNTECERIWKEATVAYLKVYLVFALTQQFYV
jgi:hypothetical protein